MKDNRNIYEIRVGAPPYIYRDDDTGEVQHWAESLEEYLRITGNTAQPTTDGWYPFFTDRLIGVKDQERGANWEVDADTALQYWADICNERLKQEGSKQRIRTREEDHGLGPDFQFIDVDRHGGEETIEVMDI